MPGQNQEAFSILTQILEYWQYNYFTEGLDLKLPNEIAAMVPAVFNDQDDVPDSGAAKETQTPFQPTTDTPIPSSAAEQAVAVEAPVNSLNAESAADQQATPPAAALPISETVSAPEVLNQELPVANATSTAEPAPVVDAPIVAADQSPEKQADPATSTTVQDSAPSNVSIPAETIANTAVAPISTIPEQTLKPTDTATKTDQTEKAKPKKGAHIIFGNSASPVLKSDGAWNFHTVLRFIRADSFTFETIFSRPTRKQPVPKATASVWFQLEKKDATWYVDYRFESNHQVHQLTFDENVTREGMSEGDKAELARHASLLASPLKRMLTIIESKELCTLEMDRIDLFKTDNLAAQSKFCPVA